MARSDPFRQVAGEKYSNQLDSTKAKSSSSDDSNVAGKLLLKLVKASRLVDIFHFLSTARCLNLAARLGDGVIPVFVRVNTAAGEIVLQNVPRISHSIMPVLTIVRHATLHLVLDLTLQLALQSVRSDGGADLRDEQQRDEEGVGVDHARALVSSAAASEKRHHENHAAYDNDEDWSVQVVV